jgi:hypothetical protein
MMGCRFAVTCVVSVALAWCVSSRTNAQTTSPLGGIWSLNRSLGESPKEIGFDILSAVADNDGQTSDSTGGRGRRGSTRGGGGRGSSSTRPESSDDVQRMRILVGEVRDPAARLTIVDTPSVVTITNDLGQSRVLHPTGREESIEVENVPIVVTATRDGARLIVLYHVEQNRDVRWTYSRSTNPSRLAVEAQLIERGRDGDKATRVYDAGLVNVAAAAQPGAALPPSAGSSQQQAAPGSQPRESFDQRPGAEFAGLKSIGILVEDLGSEARACGLRQDVIEDAVAKRLTAGGLSVRKNSDEDTYVYVNVITTSVANGTCVSRYDAFLYTQATSKLSYHDRPVLVQVSLMHRGGIGVSAVAAHSASVVRGLEGYVDVFVSQIRNANK